MGKNVFCNNTASYARLSIYCWRMKSAYSTINTDCTYRIFFFFVIVFFFCVLGVRMFLVGCSVSFFVFFFASVSVNCLACWVSIVRLLQCGGDAPGASDGIFETMQTCVLNQSLLAQIITFGAN